MQVQRIVPVAVAYVEKSTVEEVQEAHQNAIRTSWNIHEALLEEDLSEEGISLVEALISQLGAELKLLKSRAGLRVVGGTLKN